MTEVTPPFENTRFSPFFDFTVLRPPGNSRSYFSLLAGERGRSLFPLPLFDLPAGPLGQLQADGSGDSQQSAACGQLLFQVHNQYASFSVRYAFSSLMGMRTCTPRSGAARGPRSDSCWRGMNPPQRKILAAPKCLHAAARRIMEQVRRNPPHNQYVSFSVRYAFSSLMGMRTCSMVSRSRTVTHRSPGFSPSPTVSKSTVMQKGVPISSSRR